LSRAGPAGTQVVRTGPDPDPISAVFMRKVEPGTTRVIHPTLAVESNDVRR